jgi:gamma-glutamyltranspeptidase/glutathione hydrolase
MITAARRRIHTSLLAVLAVTSLAACARSVAVPSAMPTAAISDPTSQLAQSEHGMVASASKLATEVGARVLANGGNAVDAAAATAFALAVTEPNMSGLGGRSSMVIRTAEGEVYGIDGLNQVPRSFRAGAPPGYATAAIPGVPAALAHAVEKYGTWSLADIIAPAIELAEKGFPLTAQTASMIADVAAELRTHESSSRYYLKPDGSPYGAGEILVQRDLARTLRGMAEGGVDAFYRGWIADTIHADMTRKGGFITRDELGAYEALPSILVRGNYRGHDIVSNYQPASGHTVIQALHMMERFEMNRLSGADYGSIVGQAMQLALMDRSQRFGTPEESARHLTSKEYAAERGRAIGVAGPPRIPPGGDEEEPWWLRPDQDNTTHLSVVDANRMAVALTQSLGPNMGTRLAAPGLGFMYATRLGSVPGSRPGSTIAPTIVTDSAGHPRYVLGAAGDARIITAVIQTLSRAIDQKLSLDRAVAAPRVHPMGQASLRIERGTQIRWSDGDMERFRSLGFQVDTSPSTYFARVHAVSVDFARRRLLGVAEPRGNGGASGPLRAARPAAGVRR